MEWQPWETAPKDGTPFLAGWSFGGLEAMQPAKWMQGHFVHTWDHDILRGEPSHWMPLPAPPTAAE